MGGEQDAGAAGAGVGDDLEGGLDADRVDAVEGLVEQQDGGLVQGREHDAEPAAHAVAEAADDPVGDVAELEALQQVAAPRLPLVHPAQPGASCRCSTASRAGRARRRRAVADDPLDRERVGGDVVAGHRPSRRSEAPRRQDLHRRGLAGPVADRAARSPRPLSARGRRPDGLDVAEADVEVAYDDHGAGGWIIAPTSVCADRRICSTGNASSTAHLHNGAQLTPGRGTQP